MGTEAPEVADSLLRQGWYEPQPWSDIFALGLLVLDVVGGEKPQAHTELYDSDAYRADLRDESQM